MPDAAGNFKGISVPELPWQKDSAPDSSIRMDDLSFKHSGDIDAHGLASDIEADLARTAEEESA